jgi:hypothetical protein
LPKIQTQNLNWKAVAFWGITIGVISALVYINREAVIGFFTSLPSRFGNLQMPDFTGFFNGIIDYINKNPLAVIGVGASLCTAGIALIGKIRASKQTAQALVEKSQLEQLSSSKISELQQQNSDLQTKYEDALGKSNQDALLEATNLVQDQKQKFDLERQKLLGQIESLQNALFKKETQVVEKTVVK